MIDRQRARDFSLLFAVVLSVLALLMAYTKGRVPIAAYLVAAQESHAHQVEQIQQLREDRTEALEAMQLAVEGETWKAQELIERWSQKQR